MERAVRRLVRAPLFALTILATLAVGLGAFAVVTTVVHKVLIAPLPYESAEDLYYVWRNYGWFDLDRGALAGTDLVALKEEGGVITDAVALDGETATLTTGSGASAQPMEVSLVTTSPNLFDVLGVRPALGRGFAPNETGPDAPNVIVLTHDLWQRLGGERSIIGTELRLNDEPYSIIGVTSKDFEFVRHSSVGAAVRPEAFIPLTVDLAAESPSSGSFAGFVRARPGASQEQVESAVAAVGRVIDERDFQGRGLELYAIGIKPDLVSKVRPALVVLGASGVFLLLVLMVNLATLLLARAAQREKEYAVSRALGANAVAIVRATLLEGALLGLLGGAAGALVAYWATQSLVAMAPEDLPRRAVIGMSWSIALLMLAVGTLLGLLAAAAPAFWAANTKLATLLGGTNVRGGGGHGRMRRAMVVLQVALSLVLLSAGGLVVRSFDRLLRADPGFDATNVLTFRVPLPEARYPDEQSAYALQDRVLTELAALPGVRVASGASTLPLIGDNRQIDAGIPDAPGNTGEPEHDRPLVDLIGARAGYFDALGIRMLEGRGFEGARRDTASGFGQAVIDRTLAQHFFPNGGALGAKMPIGNDTAIVVGVAEHARMYDVHADNRPQLYLRADDWGWSTLSYVVRADRDAASLMIDVQRIVREIDPQLAVAQMRTMDQVVAAAVSQQRITAVMIAGFSLGALLLAAMGLFGIVAGSVTRRRHELAVRLAIGADHRRVMRHVIREGAVLTGIGLLIAVPGVYLAGQALRGVLVGVSPYDPLTLVAVAAGLALVSLAACYLPARRIAGIEPAQSLRQE